MLRAGVDLELAEHRATQPALGQHPLDRPLDHDLRLALEQRRQALRLEAARVIRVSVIDLVDQLVAGHLDP